jgi:UDPglucose 6-dehydrogenase
MNINTNSSLNISVIGLGKLGSSMAAAFANCGLNVIGVDINAENVNALNEGRAPVWETGLSEMIALNRDRLRATVSTADAVMNSNISFIIVPTPSDHRGAFTLDYAKNAFKELGRALKIKQTYHVIVMTSTVMPGSMRNCLLPLLEEESGLRCGLDFGLCYNPEFIALGSVISDFLNPDFHLLGQYDDRSGDILQLLCSNVCQNNAPVIRVTMENAELAKIALNSFVTMKISFANMLADFCEHIPGGDVDVVSNILGMDKRIGRKYLTGGMGFAGPCFPRDNVALAFLGKHLNIDTTLLTANDNYNTQLHKRLFSKLLTLLPKGGTVTVLGLSYKPLSHIVEASNGIALANALSRFGYFVKAHDRLAIEEARPHLEKAILLTESLPQALSGADAILVTTTDSIYFNLADYDITSSARKVILVDYWRSLRHLQNVENITYIPAGCCLDNISSEEALKNIWL